MVGFESYLFIPWSQHLLRDTLCLFREYIHILLFKVIYIYLNGLLLRHYKCWTLNVQCSMCDPRKTPKSFFAFIFIPINVHQSFLLTIRNWLKPFFGTDIKLVHVLWFTNQQQRTAFSATTISQCIYFIIESKTKSYFTLNGPFTSINSIIRDPMMKYDGRLKSAIAFLVSVLFVECPDTELFIVCLFPECISAFRIPLYHFSVYLLVVVRGAGPICPGLLTENVIKLHNTNRIQFYGEFFISAFVLK